MGQPSANLERNDTARRQDAAAWRVKEQLIDDDVSGLAFKFEVSPNGSAVLKLFGPILPHGNREIFFTPSGEVRYLATSVLGVERPNWPHGS